MRLTEQQLATVIAALRYYQENGQCDPDNRSAEINDIATNMGKFEGLYTYEIDDLVQMINTKGFWYA